MAVIKKLGRLTLWAVNIVFALLVLIVLAIGLLHTPFAKTWLAGLIEDQLAAEGGEARIEGIDGFIPLGMTIRSFALADAEGTWLEVENARFDVSIANLFRGALRVQAVGAERVVLERLPPAAEPVEPPSDEPFALPQLPELPESLPDLAVKRLYVDELVLGAAVLGEELRLGVRGQAASVDDGTALVADLDIEGHGTTELNSGLDIRLDLAGPDLALDLETEETGGLAARLAQMEELGDLRLAWRGQGPLADWRSRLTAEIGGVADAEFDLALGLGTEPAVSLEGRIAPAGNLLPPEIVALLPEPIELAVAAEQKAPGQFEVTSLEIDSAPVDLSGHLTIDQPAGDLDADIVLRADELDRFSGIAGLDVGGALTLRLTGETVERQPSMQLAIDGTDIGFAENGVGRIDGAFDFAFLQPLDQGFAGTTAAGRLSAENIETGGEALPLDEPVSLTLDADIRLEEESTLKTLRLTAGPLGLEAAGIGSIPQGAGVLKLVGEVASLQRLLRLAAVEIPELDGQSRIEAQIAVSDEFQTIESEVSLAAAELRGLPGEAGALIGTAPSLSFTAMARPGAIARISDLQITLAAAEIGGEVEAGLDAAERLGGRIEVAVPQLAALEPLAGQPISGRADLGLDLAGSISAPELELAADIEALSIAGQVIETIGLRASVANVLEAPAGQFRVEATQPAGRLALVAAYALEDDRLALNDFSLTGPATSLNGRLLADLENSRLEGELTGGVADFGALQPWHGQNLDGSLDIAIDFGGGGDGQRVVANLSVPRLAGDFGEVRGASLAAAIDDALGDPVIDAEFDLAGFEQPDLTVGGTSVTAKGPLADLDIALNTAGSQAGEPFRVAAAANADLAGEALRVQLRRLEGRAAGQDIRLQRPASIVREGDTLDIDRLDLAIGQARIEGGLNMDGGRVEGVVELATLPLAMLRGFGAPEIAGQASGRATLEGSLAAPRIDIALEAAGVRPDDPAYSAEFGLDIDLAASVANGSASSRIEIGNLAADPAVIEASLPLRLALEPFAFELAERAPLDGSVRGTIELGRIVDLLQLDGQVVRGEIVADLTIDGRLDQPQMLGEVALQDGLVEDSLTGLSLKFMRGRLVAEADRLRLEDFQARDGDGGKLAASGSVDIRPGRDFPYRFEVTSEDMRVLSNEIGRVYIDTDVAVEGDAGRGAAEGTVTLTRAEIAIPSGGVIDPVALDVQAVGEGKPEASDAPEAEEAAGPGYVVALDLAIDIPAELYVRGRGLDSEWGGELSIAGTSSEPVITGSIGFRRGYLNFLDRRFDIAKGEISFTGASPPVPEIELRAEAQGPTLLAIVSITGPATDPQFELSSEPPRPNDEILSELLFNRDVSAITPAQAIRLAAAVRTLEGGGFDAVGRLREAIGVDTIDIGGDDPEDATASVGKYVADGVFLELERGLSSGTSKARVEVELSDNISVNTEVSDDSQAGVGLEWSFDY